MLLRPFPGLRPRYFCFLSPLLFTYHDFLLEGFKFAEEHLDFVLFVL
jgi:hypothetical protein